MPENRPNLLVYVAAGAGVFALILGIVALVQIGKIKKQVGGVDLVDLDSRVASASTAASTAATDAKTANSRNNPAIQALSTLMEREIGTQLNAIRADIQRVEEIATKAGSRPAPAQVASGGTASPGGGAEASAAAAGQLDADGMYVIKSGDMLGKIAQQFGVSLADLVAANPGVDPRRLRVGQKIVIPQR